MPLPREKLLEIVRRLPGIDQAFIDDIEGQDLRDDQLHAYVVSRVPDRDALGAAVAKSFGIAYVTPKHFAQNPALLRYIPPIVAYKQKAFAFNEDERGIYLATDSPQDTDFLHNILKRVDDHNVFVYYAHPDDLDQGISRLEQLEHPAKKNVQKAKTADRTKQPKSVSPPSSDTSTSPLSKSLSEPDSTSSRPISHPTKSRPNTNTQAIPTLTTSEAAIAQTNPKKTEFKHGLFDFWKKKRGKDSMFSTDTDTPPPPAQISSQEDDSSLELNSSLGVDRSAFAQTVRQVASWTDEQFEAEDLPIIKLVNELLEFAFKNKSSDIHIEPHEVQSLVRFRIDGLLHDIILIPRKIHDLIVARIKILSRLPTDEHFIPQDGKLFFTVDDTRIDVRVSTIPVVYGEKVVLRLLADTSSAGSIESLGFSERDYNIVSSAISKPWGMILVTGPTGSGKTTTLYAILKRLNKREVNISTIEDPVEYDIAGISQIQANKKTGLTFAAGLRSIVRQDPDIIMVGEIRDEETAKIAVDSAMTGHLVLSTLHTNDAATAIPRMLQMGVQPFLVASTTNIIIAQRLIRKICQKCRESLHLDEEHINLIRKEIPKKLIDKYKLLEPSTIFYKGKGCNACKAGYKGRLGIFEVLLMNDSIKTKILAKANATEIRVLAEEEGLITMLEDGLQKVLAGETTIEEILRVSKA